MLKSVIYSEDVLGKLVERVRKQWLHDGGRCVYHVAMGHCVGVEDP